MTAPYPGVACCCMCFSEFFCISCLPKMASLLNLECVLSIHVSVLHICVHMNNNLVLFCMFLHYINILCIFCRFFSHVFEFYMC